MPKLSSNAQLSDAKLQIIDGDDPISEEKATELLSSTPVDDLAKALRGRESEIQQKCIDRLYAVCQSLPLIWDL